MSRELIIGKSLRNIQNLCRDHRLRPEKIFEVDYSLVEKGRFDIPIYLRLGRKKIFRIFITNFTFVSPNEVRKTEQDEQKVQKIYYELLGIFKNRPGLVAWTFDAIPEDPKLILPYFYKAWQIILERAFPLPIPIRWAKDGKDLYKELVNPPYFFSNEDRKIILMIARVIQTGTPRAGRRMTSDLLKRAAKLFALTKNNLYKIFEVDLNIWDPNLMFCLKALEGVQVLKNDKENMISLINPLIPLTDYDIPVRITFYAMLLSGMDYISKTWV